MSIGSDTCAELTRLSRLRGKDIPPAVYKRSDFKEIRTGKGPKGRTGRYINRVDGKEYPRRQVEKLIGNPISDEPASERDQAFTDAILNGDVKLCIDFEGWITSNSGRDHRSRKRKQTNIALDVDEQDTELGELLNGWNEGECAEAGGALIAGMFDSWWGDGRGGEITEVLKLDIHICGEAKEEEGE